MRFRDAIGLAVRDVTRQLGRCILTIVGVAMAAALLTSLLVIAATAKTRVIGQLTRGGPLATIRVEGTDLDSNALQRITALPGVRSVSPVVVAREVVTPPNPPTYVAATGGGPDASTPISDPSDHGPRPFIAGIVGIDVANPGLFPLSVIAGRLPSPSSMTEVAVTRDYLERAGVNPNQPARVLGTQLELAAPRFVGTDADDIWGRWTRATVVGVVAQEAGQGDLLGPAGMVLAAHRFTNSAPDPTGRFASPPYAAFLVEAQTLDRVPALVESISRLGFSTSAPQSLITTVQRYLHVVVIVLSSIGLIALGIAAIGVSSAMLGAVRERRREIGVLKAIGARDRDVLSIFLFEAFVQGVIGGFVGAAIGWAVARLVAAVVNSYLESQGLVGVRPVAPLAAVVGSAVGATVLAMVAGAVPALRAARLPARDAIGSL
ncbi:MAG TPA: ABC transporter permease [Actinomycetota bacterium]|jgi:putative ABC transport system permease protein